MNAQDFKSVLLNLRSDIPLLLPVVDDGSKMRMSTYNKTVPAGLEAAALVTLHEIFVGKITIKTKAEVYSRFKSRVATARKARIEVENQMRLQGTETS